jgi:2-phosphosulfolactate phosphatase
VVRPTIACVPLDGCDQAAGVVVVIDVLRAFTTAAYAFAAGVQRIWPAGTVEEARMLKRQLPDALLAGEVNGLPIPGFDFGNSPAAFVGLDLHGRELIQRTTAGTQGLVRSKQATHLFAASFVCARATARTIARLQPERVTFVGTGQHSGRLGEEDRACARYLTALLQEEDPDPTPWLQQARRSPMARRHLRGDSNFPASDLELALQVDRFDFAMPARRIDGRLCVLPEMVE